MSEGQPRWNIFNAEEEATKQNINAYLTKRTSDFNFQYHNQRKQREKEMHRQELMMDSMRNKEMERKAIADMQERENKNRALKNLIAEDYKQHLMLTHYRASEEKANDRREEQIRLQKAQKELEKGEKRQQEYKKWLNSQQKHEMNLKVLKDKERALALQKEKREENEANEARKLREFLKDRDFKECTRQEYEIQRQQAYKRDQKYNRTPKIYNIPNWIEKNYQNAQKKGEYGFLTENYRKAQRTEDIKNALHAQVAHKDAQRAWEKLEKQKEAEDMAQKVALTKEIERYSNLQRERNKSVYRDQLFQQFFSKQTSPQNRFDNYQAYGIPNRKSQLYYTPEKDRHERKAMSFDNQSIFSQNSASDRKFDSFEKPNRVFPNNYQIDRPAGVPSQHYFW